MWELNRTTPIDVRCPARIKDAGVARKKVKGFFRVCDRAIARLYVNRAP